jgi:hypothetical protein
MDWRISSRKELIFDLKKFEEQIVSCDLIFNLAVEYSKDLNSLMLILHPTWRNEPEGYAKRACTGKFTEEKVENRRWFWYSLKIQANWNERCFMDDLLHFRNLTALMDYQWIFGIKDASSA